MDWLYSQLPTGRLLNVGAGRPRPSPAFDVVHVDHVCPSGRSVETFVVCDAGALPFRENAFAGALLKDVVEHVADPLMVFAEARRVAPSAIVTAPRAIPRAVWSDPTHIRGFTARALQTAARMTGWVSSTPRRHGSFPGVVRLGLISHLEQIMRLPVFGHWFGTNWIVRLSRA